MSPEKSLLLLWLVLIQEGAAFKSEVKFFPNYKTISTRDSITMFCDAGCTVGEDVNYTWFKDSDRVYNGEIYTIQNAQISQSGSYQCLTIKGEISDPARLNVSDGWVILQTPQYVFERDDMKLRCHHSPGYRGRRTRFYKENKVIRDWSDDEEFHISNADKTNTGTYKCTKEVYYDSMYHQHEDEVFLYVSELFTPPTIKVTPNPVFKKENMTLKCESRLYSSTLGILLQFAFYKEERLVQGFDLKDIYKVPIVQMKHSGNYSCEVLTTDGRARKKSAEQRIQIEKFFSQPKIFVANNFTVEGDPMTLMCNTTLSPYRKPTKVQFAFYRDGREVQRFTSSNKYEVLSTHLEDSGNYTCEVKSSKNTTKRSYGIYIQIQGPREAT